MMEQVDEKAPLDEKPEILDEKVPITVEVQVEEKPKAEAAWVSLRDASVAKAIAEHNDEELARISALPGGFGSASSRRRAWIELLHADILAQADSRETTPETDTEGISVTAPHEDEGQVLLDTRRSFVTYPRGLSPTDKKAMQEDLQALIVAVLQRHPRLSYFQGLHDIISVLYLTLLSDRPRRDKADPRARAEWAELVRAAELVTLCRTRDAMGKGLAPMMGMLRLLRRLLAVADPQLYRISSSISPIPTLPFFALSWILTLFSHDVDTLEPIQRIFDYLIARNPISAIYLAVAILMAKKPQMIRLATALGSEASHDPSLLHPLFARLPPLYPDTPDALMPPSDWKLPDVAPHSEPNPYSPIPLSTVFALADKLMVKYPWDGPQIRADEVLGSGSVVRTYEKERNEGWTLQNAEDAIDNEVIRPGGDSIDKEESLLPVRWTPMGPFRALSRGFGYDRLGIFAVGIVVIGIGTALFGWQRGRHIDPNWARFWGIVASHWATKSHHAARSWASVSSYLSRTIRDVL